ncbi:ion channel POLLUX-like isoform X2 [Magnolia sinica]|uniref:ion channel POLLUX-like isoform X2 n=1 Tax=Magnolia sinica TaxID=86752 RepID=UPI00265AB9C3|nr:ion channel POLLUX-like isoform X2 [Magnolia sinica]
MPESIDGGPNPNPSKSERPPLLKKSRTISETRSSTAAAAVRRISTSPPSSHRLFSSTADDSFEIRDNGFSHRDWTFPSFLGPHPSRNRTTVKLAKSPKAKMDLPPLPPRRVQLSPPPLSDAGQKVSEEKQMAEKEDVKLVRSISSSSSVPPAAVRKIRRFNSLLIFSLLVVTSVLSMSFAAYLWIKVAELEAEIINLRRLSNRNNVVVHDDVEVLQLDDNNSFFYFSNINSRNIALYTVVIALTVPFLLFKCLDNLLQIKTFYMTTKNSEEEVPLKKRIAYRVDVFFSVYPYAKLLALLFATILLIGFGGLALYAVGDGSISEALWLSWTFVADSGNHADRVGTGPRIVSVSISSGGMLIFAMMLGLVSDAISEKVDSWRKGKSEVIESNHILILGWSDKLGSLLKQLAIANKSIGGGVVVVLAERDKEEMEMDISKLEFDFMGTSVICRSGSPLILADLKKVSVSKARAIIVLAADENADQSDARALRVVLSLTGVKEGLRGHVVVEMSDIDNEPLVKLVGGELIETVVAHDVIGRLMIQCALQPGLAQIWEDILGFENAEFYIKRWPQLDGMCFSDVLISFPDAVPCGVKVHANGGKIIINPDDDYVLKEGDEILVIAEDDDTYAPGLLPEVLEAFLAPGSELWMFNEVPEKEREKRLIDGGLELLGLANIRLVHREGNTVIRRHLESLPLETFDSILILADESLEDSVVHSDSRSLATLLLIRDIQSKRLPYKEAKTSTPRHAGFSHSSWIREMQQASDKSIIISEILDSRTRNLVSVSRISDYVLSNELVSMALAMVAEDKQINRVLEELFAEEGNEMCIRPAEFYLYDQEELCFYDIMVRARQRREIVIGYRLANAEGAIINPALKMQPRKWSLDDVFVVISLGE